MQGLTLVRSGQIQAQGSSVTAIAAIEPESTSHGKMLIYGGTDKTLHIYRDAGNDSVPEKSEEDVQ